jgi:hypothetical protein
MSAARYGLTMLAGAGTTFDLYKQEGGDCGGDTAEVAEVEPGLSGLPDKDPKYLIEFLRKQFLD